MRKKIFLYYMLLIVIGVSITGFFISELTQKFYMHEVEEKLKNTALLIENQLSEEVRSGIKPDYNEAARKYAVILNGSKIPSLENIKTRITFIDFHGTVVGESETDYHEMENHLSRKEVQEAVKGKLGEDIRTSHTLKIDFLYIAIPLASADIVLRVSVPLVQIRKIGEIFWYYTIIGIISGLFFTALLAFRFSSSATRPINELIVVSKQISLGNYSKRVNVKSKDELGQLAATFNEMAFQLEKTVADLKDKNVKVDSIMNSMISGIVAVDTSYKVMLINNMACEMFGVKDKSKAIGTNILEIIRNHQINSYLKDSMENNTSLTNEISIGSPEERVLRIYTNPIMPNDPETVNTGGIIFIQDITNVRKLEQIRTDFVSNVTHELKTPLTSIRGFVETLRSGAMNDSNVADKFLEIIDIEAERLFMLINDILQLSEIESMKKDTNISTHNLKAIIDEVVSILEGVADKKGVILSTDIDDTIKIDANKDRIKQMLINLIDNAIKYNIENGSVHVKAYKSYGRIVISVKDTGIGIAKEHLSRIFERFYRVDKGRSRNMGGTGLGLSIVKHIAYLYNGDIKVNSEPGQGTEFVIGLPG